MASPEPRTVIAQQTDYTAQCSNGIAVPNPQNNPGLVADCAALLAAKNAFTDTHQHLNWSANIPISEWRDVRVESALEDNYYRNRVVYLSIRFDLEGGSIPPELGNLANLEDLHLDGNQLTGSIPPELGNLANLEDLYLDGNQLTGSIPPELGNLANLRRLILSENQLTGSIPPELGNLANLRDLYLSENQLTGSIPPELGNLTNLDELHLNANQLTGSIPPELGNLTNLDELYLNGNQLTGCIPVALRDRDLRDQDFGSLGLPLCDAADTTPTPTPPPHPTATPPPIATPTPTATPVPPAVPDDVFNKLSALETLLGTLQGLVSALTDRIGALEGRLASLDGRVAALEADDTPEPDSTPTPTPMLQPTSTPQPTATPLPPGVTPEPTATMAPTATATPVPNPCQLDLPTGQLPTTVNGSWLEECVLGVILDDVANGDRYFRDVIFNIVSAQSSWVATLTSDDADTYMILSEWDENAESWTRLDTNDDIVRGNTNSRIEWTPVAGRTYGLTLTTYTAATLGDFTLTVEAGAASEQNSLELSQQEFSSVGGRQHR